MAAIWTLLFERDPKRRAARLLLDGARCFDKGRFQRAAEIFTLGYNEALKVTIQDSTVHHLLACLATNAGLSCGCLRDNEMADAWSRKALQHWPDWAKAHELMAKVMIANGLIEEARKEMKITLTLNQSSSEHDPNIDTAIETLRSQLAERGL